MAIGSLGGGGGGGGGGGSPGQLLVPVVCTHAHAQPELELAPDSCLISVTN